MVTNVIISLIIKITISSLVIGLKKSYFPLIAKRASDVITQTNKPEWRTIFLKHFLKQPVFLKHIFETKTLLRFPLVLSDHADVV